MTKPVPDSRILQTKAYIGGRWRDGDGHFYVINPSDGSQVAACVDCGPDQAKSAIDHAENAYTDWRTRTGSDRQAILEKWADNILKNIDSLSYLMVLEQGKPLHEARAEIESSIRTLRWSADEAVRLYGDYIPSDTAGEHIVISRHPVGVVAAITPWNFPVGMIVRKVAPALAAGCTVILKPSEKTPLCALALAGLAEEAGLPPGVLNVVPTTKAEAVGAVFTGDPRVRKLSFTGSTAVGKALMAAAAENLQKLGLELGGNAPFIITANADLERAASAAILSKFRNAGQTCICANRLFIQRAVYDNFKSIFINKIKSLKVGYGWDEDVRLGPLIDCDAVKRVSALVKDALEKGASLIYEATLDPDLSSAGTYYPATVLEGAGPDCRLYSEEIFGPVAALYIYDEESEVVRRANETPYGLAAYIWTDNLEEAWRLGDRLDFGMVGLNVAFLANEKAPFGGIKESGTGRENGRYGVEAYTELKTRLFGR